MKVVKKANPESSHHKKKKKFILFFCIHDDSCAFYDVC